MTQHDKRTGLGLAVLATFGAGLLVSTDARAHGNDYYDGRYSSAAALYDGDHDDVIDQKEWLKLRFDADRNGVLEGAEREREARFRERDPAFWQKMRAERGILRWSELDEGREVWDSPGHDRSQTHLSEHDLDRNGYLDRYEMEDLRRHEQVEQIFARYDFDRDGVLSMREARNHSLRVMFRRADRDRNGLVTFAELDDGMDRPAAPTYRSRRPASRRVASRPAFRYGYDFRFGF